MIVTAGAVRGLERCRLFLAEKNGRAAARAAALIRQHFRLLETMPEMGRPVEAVPELRELVIGFGEAGYVALYRYIAAENMVFILAFRHQAEAGFWSRAVVAESKTVDAVRPDVEPGDAVPAFGEQAGLGRRALAASDLGHHPFPMPRHVGQRPPDPIGGRPYGGPDRQKQAASAARLS